LNIWSVGTPKYLAWLQRVWQSHSRHADLRKVSNQKCPSTQKHFAGPSGTHAIGRPSFLSKILGVHSRLAGLQEHTDLGRSRVQGAQLGWQDHGQT
jgi:hypothetical protein